MGYVQGGGLDSWEPGTGRGGSRLEPQTSHNGRYREQVRLDGWGPVRLWVLQTLELLCGNGVNLGLWCPWRDFLTRPPGL